MKTGLSDPFYGPRTTPVASRGPAAWEATSAIRNPPRFRGKPTLTPLYTGGDLLRSRPTPAESAACSGSTVVVAHLRIALR